MKTITTTSLIISLTACGADPSPTILEGVWRSDRELTLENLPETLSDDRRQYLEDNLGQLHFSFRGDEIKAFTTSEEEESVPADGFRIKKADSTKMELEIHYSILNSEKVVYYWAGECFYLEQLAWGYREYFCQAN